VVHRFETSVGIAATRQRVWTVLSDVAEMPGWTASMTRVQLQPAGPLAVGSAARIRQPRLGTARWVVTDLAPERSFTWRSRRPGVTATASHVIEDGSAEVTVHLAVELSGPLARLVAALSGSLTKRYLGMEAEGLKARCEQAGPPSAVEGPQ
jgi:uncharacterized protein YndB with AHSA1/START domain